MGYASVTKTNDSRHTRTIAINISDHAKTNLHLWPSRYKSYLQDAKINGANDKLLGIHRVTLFSHVDNLKVIVLDVVLLA